MDWNQSKVGYYFDFALVPILFLLVFININVYTLPLLASVFVGLLLWTFAEYWIHRLVFHRVFRREHFLHHVRPHAYVAAPAWVTGILHFGLLTGLFASFPQDIAAGLFLGLEAGYVAYITVHDQIHHKKEHTPGSWLARRARLHSVHHHGVEANFGVISSTWDKVFHTFWAA